MTVCAASTGQERRDRGRRRAQPPPGVGLLWPSLPPASHVLRECRELRIAAEQVAAEITDPVPTLLDLYCTESSIRALLRAARRRGLTPRIIAVSPAATVVERVRSYRWPPGVVVVQGHVERLDELGLPPIDGALVEFTRADAPDPLATLQSIRHTLRPGACLVARSHLCLEGAVRAAGFIEVSAPVDGTLRTRHRVVKGTA